MGYVIFDTKISHYVPIMCLFICLSNIYVWCPLYRHAHFDAGEWGQKQRRVGSLIFSHILDIYISRMWEGNVQNKMRRPRLGASYSPTFLRCTCRECGRSTILHTPPTCSTCTFWKMWVNKNAIKLIKIEPFQLRVSQVIVGVLQKCSTRSKRLRNTKL